MLVEDVHSFLAISVIWEEYLAVMLSLRAYTLAVLFVAIALLTSGCTSTPQPQGPVIPTPAPDSGVIHGVLARADNDTVLKGIDIAAVYLAELEPAPPDVPAIVGVDKNEAPSAIPDDNGVFIFTDVPSGTYAIMVDTILSEYLVRGADAPEDDLLFDVAPGQTVDIGRVYTQYP